MTSGNTAINDCRSTCLVKPHNYTCVIYTKEEAVDIQTACVTLDAVEEGDTKTVYTAHIREKK